MYLEVRQVCAATCCTNAAGPPVTLLDKLKVYRPCASHSIYASGYTRGKAEFTGEQCASHLLLSIHIDVL